VEEAKLLSAVRSLGEAAVARPGFAGALLFYRPVSPGVVRLEGAVLRGRVVGDGLALPPSTAHEN
jgi:hypothetical protein